MPKIEQIFSYGDRGGLGVDEHGKLYWNNRAVITEQKITLQWWVNISIIIGALSTAILAILGCLRYFGIEVW